MRQALLSENSEGGCRKHWWDPLEITMRLAVRASFGGTRLKSK
jgi:hypothetical protein